MKVYIIEHAYGWKYDGDCFELEAAYTTKEDAKLHLEAIYNKLVKCQSENKCRNASIGEEDVYCEELERSRSLPYHYDAWTIEELEISEKPDLSKIEL